MNVYFPLIFKDFYCIGSQCKDNCCKMGWDIEIDDDTYKFYKSLDDDFGRKLAANISCEDGCHYIIQKNGGCPFLNEKGLCSVLLKYGEDKISEICANHPRFFEWFGDYKEAGTGLCCEKSASLWLEGEGRIEFAFTQTDEPDDDLEFDSSQLDRILKARKMLLDLVVNENFSLSQRLCALLVFAAKAQDNLDYEDIDGFEQLCAYFQNAENISDVINEFSYERNALAEKNVISDMLDYFQQLDYINENFRNRFTEIKQKLDTLFSSENSFTKAFPQAQTHYERILTYGIYRYFIKSARDYDCASKIYFAVLNVIIIKLFDLLENEKGNFDFSCQVELVKEFSKEVEYSDNMDTLSEDIYSNEIFALENMLKIVGGVM